MDKKHEIFIGSVIINIAVLIVPFFVSFIYNETITERAFTMATAMFLAGVTISSSDRSLLISIFLVIAEIFMIAAYGAIPLKNTVISVINYQTIFIFFGIIILGFDKYRLHVIKGEPLF